MSHPRRSERLYRAALRMLPQSLRDEAEDELLAVFRSLWEDEGRLFGRALLSLRLLADLCVTAFWSRSHSAGFRPRQRADRRSIAGHLDGLATDVRQGLRSLLGQPGFSAVALLVLSLGIGANATVLTLVDSLFLAEPPHVEQPEHLVRVMRTSESTDEGSLAYPDFRHYREHNETFEQLAAYDDRGFQVTLSQEGGRLHGSGWFVTDNYFDTLGVTMAAGRTFLPADNADPGAPAVTILSDRLWARAFARSTDAIGAIVRLNGHAFEVVGVAPQGFRGLSPLEASPDLWVPVVSQPKLAPTDGNYALERVPGARWVWLRAVGRLKPDETLTSARANLEALALHLQENFAEWSDGWNVAISPHAGFKPSDRAGLVSVSVLLFGAVGLLLLIVGANVAILMLARASERSGEAALRLALGASRWQVARGLLAENLLLAGAAGALGTAVAFAMADVAARWMPLPLTEGFAPSWRVLVSSLATATAVAVLASLAPTLQGRRLELQPLLLRGGDASESTWLRGGLVVAQVALSLVLIVGATLFARSVATARSVDLGFETRGRVVLSTDLRNHGYDAESGARLVTRALDRLRELPEVESVTSSMMVPFRGAAIAELSPLGGAAPSGAVLEGTSADGAARASGENRFSGFNRVGSDYFGTVGTPLIRGRGIGPEDVAGAPGVVVVNERLAQQLWPGESPIGQRVRFEGQEAPIEVVGVAANATYYELGEEPASQFWVAAQQHYSPRVNFVLSTRAEPQRIAGQARDVLLSLDPDLAMPPATTLDQAFGAEIARYSTAARLVSLFGLAALALASIGLYGVLTYSVLQRTREIGIRVALGATRDAVAATIVRRGLRLTLLGVCLGTAGALFGSRFVVSFLYGVSPTDLATFLVVPPTLLFVALLACLIPARRAARLDPVRAIRR